MEFLDGTSDAPKSGKKERRANATGLAADIKALLQVEGALEIERISTLLNLEQPKLQVSLSELEIEGAVIQTLSGAYMLGTER